MTRSKEPGLRDLVYGDGLGDTLMHNYIYKEENSRGVVTSFVLVLYFCFRAGGLGDFTRGTILDIGPKQQQ